LRFAEPDQVALPQLADRVQPRVLSPATPQLRQDCVDLLSRQRNASRESRQGSSNALIESHEVCDWLPVNQVLYRVQGIPRGVFGTVVNEVHERLDMVEPAETDARPMHLCSDGAMGLAPEVSL
jgi:hypothetical protein